jgi:hypothetical protein
LGKIFIWFRSRYIKVKVEHYLLFMFSPPKISWVVWKMKKHFLQLLPVFYLIQPSSKQIICFDFDSGKQKSVLPMVFYVPWFRFCNSLPKKIEAGVKKWILFLKIIFAETQDAFLVGQFFYEDNGMTDLSFNKRLQTKGWKEC